MKQHEQLGGNGKERKFVERLKAGDQAAFRELELTYSVRMHGLAFSMVKNVADAEDVVQDSLVRIFRFIDNFNGDSMLSTWIYRITATTALMLLRVRRSKTRGGDHCSMQFDDERVLDDAVLPVVHNLDNEIDVRDALARVGDFVKGLPPHKRRALEYKLEGFTSEEIAELEGETLATVKSRIHRVRLAVTDAVKSPL
jgi:RNA polymerase sigma-70 factor (ECF subfamily)